MISDLVWSGIAENLGALISVWWEHPELVVQLNAFRRVCWIMARRWVDKVDRFLAEIGTLRPAGATIGI